MASPQGLTAILGFTIALLLAQFIHLHAWLTLDKTAPKVIARGGFSGLFLDSNMYSYKLAMNKSVPGVVLWCDVQLTKDGAGICFPNLTLDKGSNVQRFYKKPSDHVANGASTSGFFTVDCTLGQLKDVSLTNETEQFDGSGFNIMIVEDVFKQTKPSGFWLSTQAIATKKEAKAAL